jgi:hypothetical protein
MTPYAYTIDKDYNHRAFPTLAVAVKAVRRLGYSAYSALRNPPIIAHRQDDDVNGWKSGDTVSTEDILPFTEQVEIPASEINNLRVEIEKAVAESKARYDEQVAKLKPGERMSRFSGQQWLFEIGVDRIMESELARRSVKWRDEA